MNGWKMIILLMYNYQLSNYVLNIILYWVYNINIGVKSEYS